jgi:putative oxidoreductase
MNKFLTFSFLPKSLDLALLLLRVGFGGYMLIFHGWGKLIGWSRLSGGFPDPLGVSSPVSLSLTILAEVVAAALLMVGLYSRLSAFLLTITMGVAFFMVKGAKLSGDGNGEMAALYGIVFLVLLIAGGGKYSVDRKLGH